MKYNNYDITKIYYSGYTVTAAYGCGGYQVFGTSPEPTNYKLYFTDSSGNTGTVDCNYSSNLSSGETTTAVPSPGCIRRAKVGDCVTNISTGAFYNFTCLYDITLPDTLTQISNYSFYNAHNIDRIDIPDSVTRIGDYAFQNTYYRNMAVNFPTGLTEIGVSAFEDSGISAATIYDGVTQIKNKTFYNCYDLQYVSLPSTITSIGASAFTNCIYLQSITIAAAKPPSYGSGALGNTNNCPIYVISDVVDLYKSASGWSNYADRIRGYDVHKKFKALYDNASTPVNIVICNDNTTLSSGETKPTNYMTSAEIGDCVTAIGDKAFNLCKNLTRLNSDTDGVFNIPSGITSIGFYGFGDCHMMTSVTIPDSVTYIDHDIFYGCSGMTSCTIGSGVTSISDSAFYKCSGLTSINISDNVTSIGGYAFRYCNSLTSVTIGNSVTSIGGNAFSDCTGLENFTIYAITPPTLGTNAFYGTDTSKLKIYVPAGSVDAYKAASGWSTYASVIQAIPT